MLNGQQTVSNSQCTIHGAGSTVTGSGDTLTLTLNISFSPGFAGNKVFYLAARDLAQNNSGWQAMGTWAVPPLASTSPSVGTMTPASGTGGGAEYTFRFKHAAGWQNLGVVNMLLNNFLDGRYACYLAYSRPMNVLYLVNDAGGGLLPGLVANGTGTISNSQCTISNPVVTGSGDTMEVKMIVNFGAGFTGNRIWYLAARDSLGNNSGWQAVGSWAVGP